jgi:uncharacterized protein (TIGR02118 family)
MVKISIFYPNTPNTFFDEDYYLNMHIPRSVTLQGKSLKGTQVETGITGVPEGTKPPFRVMCHFYYDSIQAFLDAFLPHQEELTADIKNYTNVEPVIQISEVRVSAGFKQMTIDQ